MGTRVPAKQGTPLIRSGSTEIIPARASDGGTRSVANSVRRGWETTCVILTLLKLESSPAALVHPSPTHGCLQARAATSHAHDSIRRAPSAPRVSRDWEWH